MEGNNSDAVSLAHGLYLHVHVHVTVSNFGSQGDHVVIGLKEILAIMEQCFRVYFVKVNRV